MPLYRMEPGGLVEQTPATFRDLHLYERGDLQRLLRAQPEALGEPLLIVSEEFGSWEDSRRRLDLLALDQLGNLVVIELKRTEDGGHMELQALRYAAMVSSMTFDEVTQALAAHREHIGEGDGSLDEARSIIADFLDSDGDSIALSTEVRIILVSADFGREITTTVLWLNRFEGMDLRCVRLKPYEFDGKVILDIDQVLPLPEAADYQVRIKRKDAERARSASDGRDFTKYVISRGDDSSGVLNKRNAVRKMVDVMVTAGTPVSEVRKLFRDRIFLTVPGTIVPGEACEVALHALDPKIDVKRYFTDSPIHEGDETHIMFRMWGMNTEESLRKLQDAFPQVGATFRAVRPEDG